MTKVNHSIFVLWASFFDEALAVEFVTQARRASIKVKLVGIYGRPLAGKHGVILTPDLTLTQAITQLDDCGYILVPCGSASIKKFAQDRRLRKFCRMAAQKDIHLGIGCIQEADIQPLSFLATLPNLTILSSQEEIQAIVSEIAITPTR